MKNAHFLSMLVILSISPFTMANTPFPLVLKTGEEISYKGNKWDIVSCGAKQYVNHDLSIVVTSVAEDCNCDTPKVSRIYEDGLFKGVCKGEIKISLGQVSSYTFVDFSIIGKLKDSELSKLLMAAPIGGCQFDRNDIYSGSSIKLTETFTSYKMSIAEELGIDDENSSEVFLKSVRAFVKDGYCGTKESITPEMLANSGRILGKNNIAFDLMISQGKTGEDLVKMGYSASSIRAKFAAISVDLYKKNGYLAADLIKAGFSNAELIAAKFSASDLYGAGVPVAQLKDTFSVKELASSGIPASAMKEAGFSVAVLKDAGYSLIQLNEAKFTPADLKSVYSLKDLIASADYYGRRTFSLESLRQDFGYVAKEMKEAGVSMEQLKSLKYDLVADIKPLYTLHQLRSETDYYGRRIFGDDVLRTVMGFSAADMKSDGATIELLKSTGYSAKEIKPIYSAKELRAASDYYGRRIYSDEALRKDFGYSASELKAAGVSISDLQSAGYDIVSEIKPLFTTRNFIDVVDYYGRRTYSNEFLRKNLGITAAELKQNGISLLDLQAAGYDMAKEVKPLFKVSDFLNSIDYNGRRNFPNEYLRKSLGYSATDLKQAGVSIQDLQSAGFNMANEIKPLFQIQDFVKLTDYYGRRVYSNVFLRQELGYSVKEMKAAGIGLKDLYDAGFTKQELRDGGFSVAEVDKI